MNGQEIIDCQSGLDWLYQMHFAKHYEEPKQARNAQGEVDVELVRKALKFIPADDYGDWIDIGMALKAVGVDFEVWDEWSSKSGQYDPAECVEKWDGFKPDGRIGIGSVFHLAKKHGFRFQANSNQDLGHVDWSNPETFGEPILFGEIETPEITSKCLPTWVQNYVDALAAHTQTPVGVATMLALSVLAACLQKRFKVAPYGAEDGYAEPLSIWTMVALPPASRKTALLQALREPIVEWEREESQRLLPEIERQRAERAVITERIKVLTNQAGKAEE